MPEKISKRQIAIQTIENNFCMLNGMLSKQEQKQFKDKDFASYLVNSLRRLDQLEKQNKENHNHEKSIN